MQARERSFGSQTDQGWHEHSSWHQSWRDSRSIHNLHPPPGEIQKLLTSWESSNDGISFTTANRKQGEKPSKGLQGSRGRFFVDDPYLNNRIKEASEVPDVIRWFQQNTVEIFSHIVFFCGALPLMYWPVMAFFWRRPHMPSRWTTPPISPLTSKVSSPNHDSWNSQKLPRPAFWTHYVSGNLSPHCRKLEEEKNPELHVHALGQKAFRTRKEQLKNYAYD